MSSVDKTTVLFFAEAVTLAHVARPVLLAEALDPGRFAVHFAHCPRYRSLLGDLPFTEHRIDSIAPEQFTEALAKGEPLYNRDTLVGYVEQDLEVIARVKPDIIVGDFRLSLAVSAELAGVPYATISNACWSPYTSQRYTVPELPFTRILGVTLGQWLFSAVRPIAFASHCQPMRRLRRKYGLKSLGWDLRKVYTHADYTLYADIPGLYRTSGLPENHQFIGPVIWSPKLPLPDWWGDIPRGKPVIYVTMGSSGEGALLPEIIRALSQLDVIALVASAGLEVAGELPGNVYLDKYLPGEKAAGLSDLVICNGGSPTTHQALVAGVPVIGLAGNLDQYLNMATIDAAGAGRLLRSGTCTAELLSQTVEEVLADPSCRTAARNLAKRVAEGDAVTEFTRIINTISG